MTVRKVYQYEESGDSPIWCEACGNLPEGTKIYIDEYKGFNPAYWCEQCIKGQLETLKFEVIGWITKVDYLELQKKFVSSNWPKY